MGKVYRAEAFGKIFFVQSLDFFEMLQQVGFERHRKKAHAMGSQERLRNEQIWHRRIVAKVSKASSCVGCCDPIACAPGL